MKRLFYILFSTSIAFCFNTTAQAKKMSVETLELLTKAKQENALLMSDSSCRSCSKLIKKIPTYCDQLKTKSFAVLATGNIKKNKRKLSAFEKSFNIFYSKDRRLLSKMKAPATPTLLINQERFVVGYNAITKYFKENIKSFCESKKVSIKL